MPTRLNTNFPRPTDPVEFESMIRDICAIEWNDLSTQKFGRKGQKQFGVDVYGHPCEDPARFRGAQCKLRTQDDQLSRDEIEVEVAHAKNFPHSLEKLIIATDAPRDTNTQVLIDEINEREVANSGFQVAIWFWDDITERISTYQSMIVKYYKDFYANLTSLPIVERLADEPLRIFVESVGEQGKSALLEDLLRLRGVQILTVQNTPPQLKKFYFGNDYLDGYVVVLDSPEEDPCRMAGQKCVGLLQAAVRQIDDACPIFLVLESRLLASVNKHVEVFDINLEKLHICTIDEPIAEVADTIFSSVFSYGFSRRGGIRTIDICVRAHETKPSSVLLDMNWHLRLTTKVFPDPKEWEELFVPAILSVKSQLLSQGDVSRIQINSQLPIPAAIALGFYISVREARVGVWARKTGVSDFKEQFWLSDSSSATIDFNPEWYKNDSVKTQSAIVEVTTYVPIHMAVEPFVSESKLETDKWLSMCLKVDGRSPVNINDGQAIAFADQVGQQIRLLNGQGITDIHLFARMPSALGVLIGQRFQACGRIHLYWFDNPTYRYAFSLS